MAIRLETLRFDNFRAFPNSEAMEVCPLTLIFGRNGSGKSSILSLPSLIANGLRTTTGDLAQQLLGDSSGLSAAAIVYGANGGEVGFGLDYSHDSGSGSLDVALLILPGTVGTHTFDSASILRWTWQAKDTGEKLELEAVTPFYGRLPTPSRILHLPMPDLEMNDPGRDAYILRYSKRTAVGTRMLVAASEVSWRGLFPLIHRYRQAESKEAESPELPSDFPNLRRLLPLQTLHVSSLRAMRSTPSRIGLIPTQADMDSSNDGSGAAAQLALDKRFRSGRLLARVDEWYRKNLGWGIDIELNGSPSRLNQGSYSCVIQRLDGAFSIPIASHGAGMSQVLPVVVRCMATQLEPSWASVLTLEEPETHLHPGAHGALADLLIDTAMSRSVPLIVESHSDVTLLRIRRRIAEHAIRPDQVAFYWIDEKNEKACLHRLNIESDGWIEDWPHGVFAEDSEEARAIAKARRNRQGDVP